jgi:uncharacterized protein (TIGR03066 family)
MAIGFGIACMVVSNAAARDDSQKIIGVWLIVKGADPGSTIEFANGGKTIVNFVGGGMNVKTEGTYAVDGDKLILTNKGSDQKDISTIITLTDTKIELKDATGTEVELKRQSKEK